MQTKYISQNVLHLHITLSPEASPSFKHDGDQYEYYFMYITDVQYFIHVKQQSARHNLFLLSLFNVVSVTIQDFHFNNFHEELTQKKNRH